MKEEITSALVSEHKLILRMLDVLERVARATAAGEFSDFRFYLEAVDFIRLVVCTSNYIPVNQLNE